MKEMEYITTRGKAPVAFYCDAVMAGFAPDKGLYVPRHFPHMHANRIQLLRAERPSYCDTQFEWTFPFVSGIGAPTYKNIIESAFSKGAWGDDPAPVRRLTDQLSVFELFHGPSGAFKDHPMQPVAREFEYLLAITNRKITIVVATSGDTGPAAIEAFRGLKNVRVVVFFPKDGTSDFQRKQMTAMATGNVFVVAVDGSFDDCQAIVKELGNRRDLVEALCLSGVNSINWGRIKYQIGYYPYAWSRVAQNNSDIITVVVPSGNFGNALAGIYAQTMGLPIRIVIATNANRILVDFFRSGVYRPWKEEIRTISPSMNITKASNIERLIFLITGCDADRTRAYMEQVEKEGGFTLDPRDFDTLRSLRVHADFVTDDDCTDAIRTVYHAHDHYVMDTHTAVGYTIAQRILKRTAGQVVVMSTAAPYKFDPAVSKAIGHAPARPLRFIGLESARDASNVVYLSKDANEAEQYLRNVVAKAA